MMRKIFAFSLAIIIPISSPVYSDSNGIFSPSVGIFSCEASGNKQKTGAVIGALIGGAIANKTAKKNKTLATVIGAGVGGMAGSYIGCSLQKKDQERLAKDSERAMVLGEDAIYENKDANIYVTTNVTTQTYATKSNVKLAKDVVAPSSLTLVGGRYIAPKTLNIKSTTLEKAKTIGTINANQEFDVLGYTNTKTKWAAIGNEGVIIGFVPLNNIVAIGKIASTTSSSTLMAKSVEIPINGMCREVSQSIQQNGETSKDGTISRKACVQADGKWHNA